MGVLLLPYYRQPPPPHHHHRRADVDVDEALKGTTATTGSRGATTENLLDVEGVHLHRRLPLVVIVVLVVVVAVEVMEGTVV